MQELKIITGYVQMISPSPDNDLKAMEEITNLGALWLTHKPQKMLWRLGSATMPVKSAEDLIEHHPHLKNCFEESKFNPGWVNVKKGCEDVTYEDVVWGDDWNDRPASCNAGPPYGGEHVQINRGDLVIVIKAGGV